MARSTLSPDTTIRWPDGTEATLGEYQNGEYDFMSDDFEVVREDRDCTDWARCPKPICTCKPPVTSPRLAPADDRPAGFWDGFFLTMADHVATASKDPSTKVGCVLVDAKRRVIGVGYNGFPRGVRDLPERYADRPTKYQMVQHAEANAVLQATAPTDGATAFVTHPPCCNCAGILIQAGIKRVVTRTPDFDLALRFKDSFNIADTMFSEAGVYQRFIA